MSDDEKTKKAISALWAIPISVVGMVAVGALWAHVIGRLWTWFLTPLISIPAPGIWQTMGLGLIFASFARALAVEKFDPDGKLSPAKKAATRVFSSAAGALLIWGIGAIYAHMMVSA